ncbi:unnamed protein product [Cunninghamella echinulata]
MPEKEQTNPKFKKYVQLIERNLQSFDAVNEWADIISFLGKLLKSFQAYPQFKTIPHKQIVSKRLAQCLNPDSQLVYIKKLWKFMPIYWKLSVKNNLLKTYLYGHSVCFPLYNMQLLMLSPNY